MGMNTVSRLASRPRLAGFLASIVASLSGCHSVPLAPVVVAPAPGTVRVLGAVALPQVATIPPGGLTLAGALELAGGVVAIPALTAPAPTPAPAPAPAPALGTPAGPPPVPRPAAAATTPDPVDPGALLIGLRRIVNGVPNTNYFAVPLVLKYEAGTIPLQDGDQVRVVPYKSTSLGRSELISTSPGAPSPEITVFSGTPLDADVRALDPKARPGSYLDLARQINYAGDPNGFDVMQSLTRINPNDDGVETFIIPKNKGEGNGANDPFPLFDSRMRDVMKTQPGDVFGLTTLPQVAAIAVPKLTAATNTLLDLARTSREPAVSESRLRRTLNSLGRGQLPTVSPLPTAPVLPRSLDFPDGGVVRARLEQHGEKKRAARGVPVVVGTVSSTGGVVPSSTMGVLAPVVPK